MNRRSTYVGRREVFLKKTGADNSQKREGKRRRVRRETPRSGIGKHC